MRKRHGFDLLVGVAGQASGDQALAFFAQVNVKWIDRFGLPSDARKGLVRDRAMIANDEQLRVVQEQVGRLEAALRSLAVTVRPQNERQFRVMAEGHVDHLRQLRREIDEYVGIPAEVGTA